MQSRNLHDIPLLDAEKPELVETATFAMGCFWGPDAMFGIVPGVVATRVGYAGGSTADPTYRNLGDHTESVQIDFDPSKVSFVKLLEMTWCKIDPYYKSAVRRYMSILFYHNPLQKAAIDSIVSAEEDRVGTAVAVDILPYDGFYLAEEYHQKYYLKTMSDFAEEYCEIFGTPGNLTGSTAVARVNGYVSGMGNMRQLEEEIDLLGLSEKGRDRLGRIVALYRR